MRQGWNLWGGGGINGVGVESMGQGWNLCGGDEIYGVGVGSMGWGWNLWGRGGIYGVGVESMGQINGVGMESMGGINGVGVESGSGVKSMGWGWNLWGRGGLWGSPTALCPPPSPHQFHYDHNRAQFYVEDASTASALKQVSRKITDRDNYKVGGEGPGRSQGCGVGGWGGWGGSWKVKEGVEWGWKGP